MDKHKIESAIHELRNSAIFIERSSLAFTPADRERVGEAIVALGPDGLRAIANFLSASLELRP